MNFNEAIYWIYNQFPSYQKKGKSAYKEDIDNVKFFFDKHNFDLSQLKSIHIAGTNGKGSVAHMLCSVLQQSAYKVGLFTSPHILDFRERIKIDGVKISKVFVEDFINKYKRYFEKTHMSFFEMNVAMAFDYFISEKVDFAIIEVGLGGRLDATNVISPILSIITNTSIDHTNLLGNSLESITHEKAGIVKENTPILIGEKNSCSYIIEKNAKKLNAPIYYSSDYNYNSDLKGEYQNKNINTCISAIHIMRAIYDIKDINIIGGLLNVVKNTGLLGRWQVLNKKPKVICDIAHNYNSIELLVGQLLKLNKRISIILGFSHDKETNSIVSLFPPNFTYYLTGSYNSRILDPNKLSKYFDRYNLNYEVFDFAFEAYDYLLSKTDENDLICICGSTFIVSDLLKYLDKA